MKYMLQFLQTQYSDQNLVDALAHARRKDLSFTSCCCFIGIPNAPHPLRGFLIELATGRVLPPQVDHYLAIRHTVPGAMAAEEEFEQLGFDDLQRCERLIPILEAEMERRAMLMVNESEDAALSV